MYNTISYRVQYTVNLVVVVVQQSQRRRYTYASTKYAHSARRTACMPTAHTAFHCTCAVVQLCVQIRYTKNSIRRSKLYNAAESCANDKNHKKSQFNARLIFIFEHIRSDSATQCFSQLTNKNEYCNTRDKQLEKKIIEKCSWFYGLTVVKKKKRNNYF